MNLDKLLEGIQKPARYIGGEYNSIQKPWDTCSAKVCLSYPDIYEVGMSYLGIQILYHLINQESDSLCERVFAPWPDMEKRLKETGLNLFSLESKKPLKDFDIVGFSLGYELIYTNMLNMLALGGIPVFSGQRDGKHPIVIAGGPCVFNPAPISDFVDVFFIGEAEESILTFLDLHRQFKVQGRDRISFIEACGNIEGLYVPRLHKQNFKIKKRFISDLNSSFYPTNLIVPFIKTIHDRVPIEIMRGCPNTCRFCQARSIYSPARLRSKDKIVQLAISSLQNTGYDEISFLSLSSSNHPYLLEAIDEVNGEFDGRGINISIPSLRIEDLCQGIPDRIAKNRKTGLTFAPEAGSQRIREIVNKQIEIPKLFQTVKRAFELGWRRVKLYFMIGIPGETEDDIDAIAMLASQISCLKKEVDRKRAEVHLSINSFIPKPHTPFQWLGMEAKTNLIKKQKYLKAIVKDSKIKLDFQDIAVSVLEASLSRGHRAYSKIVYKAWEKGARLDAWRELFNVEAWEHAFSESGMSLYESATRPYRLDEDLPWDFIDIGIPKAHLIQEAKKANVIPTQ